MLAKVLAFFSIIIMTCNMRSRTCKNDLGDVTMTIVCLHFFVTPITRKCGVVILIFVY